MAIEDDLELATITDDVDLVSQVAQTQRYFHWTGRMFTHCVVSRIGDRSWSIRGRPEPRLRAVVTHRESVAARGPSGA